MEKNVVSGRRKQVEVDKLRSGFGTEILCDFVGSLTSKFFTERIEIYRSRPFPSKTLLI